MSHTTSIILITAINDGSTDDNDPHPNVDRLNEYLKKENLGNVMKECSDFSGGSKVMGCEVFLAGINHLNIPKFLDAFHAISWESPESVQLLLMDEHEESFSEFKPKMQ